MYDIVRQHLSNMTKIEQNAKKDDNEKYACNKDNALSAFTRELNHKNEMKKK